MRFYICLEKHFLLHQNWFDKYVGCILFQSVFMFFVHKLIGNTSMCLWNGLFVIVILPSLVSQHVVFSG